MLNLEPWGGGGGALRYRVGPHLRYVFRGRMGSFFKTSACPRFCKRRVLTIHETYAALTPSDSRSIWASEFAAPLAAAKHAEDYKI